MSRQNSVADQLRDLGDYGVSAGANSVHPIGNPIISSAKCGCVYRGELDDVRNASAVFAPRKVGEPRKRFDEAPLPSLFPIVGINARRPFFNQPFKAFTNASCDPGVCFPPRSDLLGVGNNPDAISVMAGAKGGSWYAMPLRIIPERGQGSENGIQPSRKQRADVLQDNKSRSQVANKTGDLIEKTTSLACESGALPCKTDVLAWETARNDIDGNSIGSKSLGCEFAHVAIAGDVWPVLCEDTTGELLNFAERDGLETARPFKTQRKAADAGKQVEDAQLVHDASPCPTPEAPL